MKPYPHLAILDWGIGGVGVASAIAKARPEAGFVYVSDSGFTPYGKVPPKALLARLRALAHWLSDRGVTHLAIACNAASTVAEGLAGGPLEATGIIAYGVRAVRRARAHHVAILGGRRTIRSGVYRRALAKIDVVQRIAQPLSAYVERGIFRGAALERELATIVHPIRKVPVVLLACTHYPALRPALDAHFDSARILDPAEDMARDLLRVATPGPRIAITSGDPAASRRVARLAFAFDLGPLRRFSLRA